MSIFESEVQVAKPVKDVYNFLADLNNHQQLMGDSVQDWESTRTTMSFNVQNLIKLSLKVKEPAETNSIKIIPAEKPPFDLELKWTLTPGGTTTKALFTITAELSMMLKIAASGPLKNLAEQETQNLVSILG